MDAPGTQWWIGTYPEAGAGTPPGLGEGIWRVALDPATGALSAPALAARTPAPTFLATHPSGRVLYAGAEHDPGTVTAFAVADDGSLEPRGVVGSGGTYPCHLLLAPDARTLYVANYGTGTLGVLTLGPDGLLTREALAAGSPAQVFPHTGSGPRADRQESSHAHFVALAPGGWLLVSDLGTDELRRYRLGPNGLLQADGVVTLPPGTGPRHLAAGPALPDGTHPLYVAGELANVVLVLRWRPATGTADVVQGVVATRTPPAPASAAEAAAAGGPLASHLVLDGDRVVVAMRGPDVLVVLPVDPATGLLGDGVEVGAGGAWPRHFAVDGGRALVADQGSDGVAVVPLPGAGRASSPVPARVPAAACVVPVVAPRG